MDTEIDWNLVRWDYLNDDKINWISSEGEKQLAFTCTISDSLDRKVGVLTGFAVGLLTGLTGYGLSQKGFVSYTAYIVGTAHIWVAVVCLIFSMSCLFAAMRSSPIYSLGHQPFKLLNKDFIKPEIGKVKEGYIKELDRKIRRNREINSSRCKYCDYAIYALAASPILGIVTRLIVVLVS